MKNQAGSCDEETKAAILFATVREMIIIALTTQTITCMHYFRHDIYISLQDLWKQQQRKLEAQLRRVTACLEAKKEDPDYVKAAIKELQHQNSQKKVRIKHALSFNMA